MRKYIHCFETTADFEAEYNGNGYSEPWVSAIKNGGVAFNKPRDPFNGHEYVDLGLPSGTLWAKCNLGATAPGDFGDYYRWGETTPLSENNDTPYKWEGEWVDGVGWNYESTKYNNTNGKTVLDLEDDAAHAIMGGDWHMPTAAQIQELLNYTTIQESSSPHPEYNFNRSGLLFTSQNGNSIFIPYDGFGGEGESIGWQGGIWSNTLSSSEDDFSYLLSFQNGYAENYTDAKDNYCSVRGVIG